MKNEGDVKKAVRKILDTYKDHGWYFMPPANGYGRSGIPDLLGCINGYMYGIETKFGNNKLTANQVREMNGIVAANAKHFIVSDRNIDEVMAEFKSWADSCL